jgi:hypothetical protein
MKKSNEEQISDDGEEYSCSDDLLLSYMYGPRQFFIAGNLANPVVGVVLEETQDSFLVAMPVQIVTENCVTTVTAVGSAGDPFVRLMKSAVTFINFPCGPNEQIYEEYILENAPNVFPELPQLIGLEDIPEQLIDEEDSIDADDEFSIEDAPEKAASSIVREVEEVVNGPNLSHSDVEEKYQKALLGGYFIPTDSKVKH